MTTNQTAPVTDEELDHLIWGLERYGLYPRQLAALKELREVRRAKGNGRDQFEEWFKFHHGEEGSIVTLHRANGGANYADPHVDLAWIAWKDSRAAMLQLSGNSEQLEPVSNRDELPFEQWLSQQEGSIDVDCGCVMTEVLFHWMRVAYEAGNCRENEDSSTKNFREISETSTNCPKCGGRGTYHCPQMLGTVECECECTLSAAPKEVKDE